MKFSVFQISRKGGRLKNEDRMGYCYTRESGLFVLADGMGGHPQGEVAAQLALQSIAALYQRQARPRLEDVRGFLAAALLGAHHEIMHYAGNKGMLNTPRTTVVVAVVQDGAAMWAHCGDSRLYLVRQGVLMARTRDHTHVERPEMAPVASPGSRSSRNHLLTCLGSPVSPVFDLSQPMPLRQGDRILLCSDGLWGVMEESQMVRMLSHQPVSQAVPELVEMALRLGGAYADNVTALALEWEMPGAVDGAPAISTDGASDGFFASTIQEGNVADEEVDGLDDEAIERTIAEINEAIARSAVRRS